jgi:diacylglycerol kinase family enzyme
VAELSRLAVIRNPRSGTAIEPATLANAFAAAGLTADILDLPDDGRVDAVLETTRDHDVLVAAGGDGTVSAVAAVAAKTGKTLAIIPGGTLNHFARDAGIPNELDQAVAIIRNGVERCIDVGVVNEQFFLNNVSLGNYPRMVDAREALERRGKSHTVATTIAVARTWWKLRKLTAWLTIDDRTMLRRSPFVVIGNGSYQLSGLSLGQREQINDGQLSLYVAPPTGRFGVLTLPMRALVGTLERHEQFETFQATRIAARFTHPRVSVAVDGEVREMQTPLEFSIHRNALRLLVPSA